MKESKIAEVRDCIIAIKEQATGNLVLNDGIKDIIGYAISSITEGGGKPGKRYCLAQWGNGKESHERGREKLKEGRWLVVEAMNPPLENDQNDLPDSIISGEGIIVRDNSDYAYYVSPEMVNNIVGLLPNDIFKSLESSK